MALAGSCDGGASRQADAGPDDGDGGGLPVDAERPLCVSEDELSLQESPYPLCDTPIEYREPNFFIDLTGTERARCDNWTYGLGEPNFANLLPDDPALYPVLVRVSTAGFNGSCDTCVGQDRPTAYGVAIAAPASFLQELPRRYLIARAPAPWFVVTGGTGEADPYPCAGGYQEYYEPRPCLWSHSHGYGIVTADPDAPAADIWFDILPEEYVEAELLGSSCCPYGCPQ